MNKVTVYTTALCPYCYRAKKLLAKKGVEIEEIDVMFDADKRQEMMARSGRKTVPQIFIAGGHVGGFDDLAALDHAGKLEPLLRAEA